MSPRARLLRRVLMTVAPLAALALAARAHSDEPRAKIAGWRFYVHEPGVYGIPISDLPGHALCANPGAAVDPGLVLEKNGKPVPFHVLDGNNVLLFQGDVDPDARDARGSCYVLRPTRPGEKPLWLGAKPPVAAPATPGGDAIRFRFRPDEAADRRYEPLVAIDVAALSPTAKKSGYWFLANDDDAKVKGGRSSDPLGLTFNYVSGKNARLHLSGVYVERLQVQALPGGRAMRSVGIAVGKSAGKLRVLWGKGQKPIEVELGKNPPEGDAFTVDLPDDAVTGHTFGVSFEAVPPGRVLVQDAVLEIDSAVLPVKQLAELARPFVALGPTRFPGERADAIVADLADGSVYALGPDGSAATPAGHEIAILPREGGHALEMEISYASDLTDEGQGADWVAITPRAYRHVLAPLADFRAEHGLKTKVVALEDVLDAFSHGAYSGEGIRSFLAYAQEHWKPAPRFVLLAGDAWRDARPSQKGAWVPTLLEDTYDNGASASDGKMAPRGVAIGRFPCRTEKDLASFVAKTIAYEKAPSGPWQRQLAFVCGEGRFGPAVDGAIEQLFTAAVQKRVPESYDVDVTYGNPTSIFFYPPQEFSQKVVERLSEGPLIFDYVGHGAQLSFDDVHWGSKRFPILRREDAEKVKCAPGRNPIVLVTACWTGCFDQPDKTVGEALALNPDGAVAVIAASRISHPLANALLSLELTGRLFDEPEDGKARPRLGAILRGALEDLSLKSGGAEGKTVVSFGRMMLQDDKLLARLMDDERRLYNLLGDPALQPRFPKPQPAVELPGDTTPGSLLEIGSSEIRELTLERPRALRRDLKGLDEGMTPEALLEPDVRERVLATHARANDPVLSRGKRDGDRMLLEIPTDLKPGNYVLKVWTRDGGTFAARIDVDEGDPVRPVLPAPKKKKYY